MQRDNYMKTYLNKKEAKDGLKLEKAYRTKHKITTPADICEMAHNLLIKDYVKKIKEAQKKTFGRAIKCKPKLAELAEKLVNCSPKSKCEDYDKESCNDKEMTHYSAKAQSIFNDYYDLISANAGM